MGSHQLAPSESYVPRHPPLQAAAILIALSLFLLVAIGSVVAFGSGVPSDVLESFNER